MPSDRNSRPTDVRRSASSSMTNTVGVASDIAATRRSRESACGLLQPWRDGACLVPMLEPEQSDSSQRTRAGYTKVYAHRPSSARPDAQVSLAIVAEISQSL